DIVTKELRLEQSLPRLHPVDVAAQRVDFAVVRDVPEGMCEGPTRERVGAETLVHDSERRNNARVAEVRKIDLDLFGGQHAFVNQGSRREAREVELRRGLFDTLANQVELSLEVVDALDIPITAYKDLLENRFDGLGALADRGIVSSNVSPSENRLARAPDGRFNDFLAP